MSHFYQLGYDKCAEHSHMATVRWTNPIEVSWLFHTFGMCTIFISSGLPSGLIETLPAIAQHVYQVCRHQNLE